MVTELTSKITIDNLQKIKDDDPQKYDETLKLIITITEVATHILNNSPGFRKAFAEIHKEFLKHPESREVIDAALKAYNDYTS